MSYLEEIKYSPTLSIWKSKFDTINKIELIKEAEEHIKSQPEVKNDGYAFYLTNGLKYDGYIDIKKETQLDGVLHSGIEACIRIYNENFNEIKMDAWVNVVRVKDPIQKNYKENGDLIFHNHVDLNINNKRTPPQYTFVAYIQMPDNLNGDDGVLFMEDYDGKVYSILPEENDIIIMKGDLPHVPNYAPNSTKDRIVLAGSIRMDFSKLKTSLI